MHDSMVVLLLMDLAKLTNQVSGDRNQRLCSGYYLREGEKGGEEREREGGRESDFYSMCEVCN